MIVKTSPSFNRCRMSAIILAMDVSVIIPAHNASPYLAGCLRAVFAQVTEFQYEVIVVDDQSADNTAHIAQTFPVRLLTSPQRLGKSGARNWGAQHARAPIILFTDADCEPLPSWLACMVAPFSAEPTLCATKGAYLTRQTELVSRAIQLEFEERYERMASHPQINFIDTYSAAFRRDLFLQYGGFDPELTFSMVEDQEYSFRLAAERLPMRFVPAARLYHPHTTSLFHYAKRKYRIAYWKALIVQRHPSRRVKDSHTPESLKVQMGLVLLLWPLLCLVMIFRPLRFLLPLWLTTFLGTQTSLFALALRYDPSVAPFLPLFLFVRGMALAVGYLYGSYHWRGARVKTFLSAEFLPLPSLDGD